MRTHRAYSREETEIIIKMYTEGHRIKRDILPKLDNRTYASLTEKILQLCYKGYITRKNPRKTVVDEQTRDSK